MSDYNLKLDGDTADKLVVSVLKDHKEICDEIITKLKSKVTLENHEKIDLVDYVKTVEAMEEVLKYFGE